jgi:hypothetical protein
MVLMVNTTKKIQKMGLIPPTKIQKDGNFGDGGVYHCFTNIQ